MHESHFMVRKEYFTLCVIKGVTAFASRKPVHLISIPLSEG